MKVNNWYMIVRLFAIIISLSILNSCSNDNEKITEPANSDPVIHNVIASPSSIKVNETTILTCIATDADGDSLYYNWYADYGTFPNGASDSSVTW